MQHDIFAHLGAWLALSINIIGLLLIVFRGGKVIGELSTAMQTLSSTVTQLSNQVNDLRKEMLEQAKLVANMEGRQSPR